MINKGQKMKPYLKKKKKKNNGRLKRQQLSMFDPVFDRLQLQILPKDV